ncbi:MAG: hypothetical protein ACLP7O_16050 [Terracidiphilus sp.]
MRICGRIAVVVIVTAVFAAAPTAKAAARKAHTVVLGAVVKRPYSKAGDPAGAAQAENELKIRALLVDGVLKEWTTGEAHDVTDRSFVVRRVIKLNDTLPSDQTGDKSSVKPVEGSATSGKTGDQPVTGDKTTAAAKPAPARAASPWVWQRGPWLLVDRATGRIVALKLPDYDPGVSQVSWFRDYGAYCGVTASGKSLYAVVAQVEARKPVLARKLAAFDAENHPDPVCGPAEWQREPLRITFHPAGKDQVSFDVVPGSAVLVEDAGEEAETPAAVAKAKPK